MSIARRLLPALLGTAATALALTHLFVPHTIGSSDTGDGLRLTCQLGVADLHEFRAGRSSSTRFVAIRYDHQQPTLAGCGPWRTSDRYPSSTLIVLWAGKAMTGLLRLPGALDMRVVGVLYAVLFGIAIAVLTIVLPGNAWTRGLTGATLIVLGSDATFVPYFISPFSEPTEYIGLLFMIAGLLALWRRDVVRPLTLFLTTLGFALLITAKTQLLPFAGVLGLALLTIRSPIGRRLRGRIRSRLLSATAVVALLGVTAGSAYLQPIRYTQMLTYSDVFYTILRRSPDPVADLKDMGLPTELRRYVGLTFFQTDNQTGRDANYQVFLDKVSLTTVAWFYLRHPGRLAEVSASVAKYTVRARHPLPNTLRGQTARPATTCRICIIAWLGPRAAPAGPVLLPLWELAVLIVGLLLWWRRHERPWRALGQTLVTMVVLELISFYVAILGDGDAELSKHVFGAATLAWLAIPLVGLGIAGLLGKGQDREGPRDSMAAEPT